MQLSTISTMLIAQAGIVNKILTNLLLIMHEPRMNINVKDNNGMKFC
jgi:hypothetical protein